MDFRPNGATRSARHLIWLITGVLQQGELRAKGTNRIPASCLARADDRRVHPLNGIIRVRPSRSQAENVPVWLPLIPVPKLSMVRSVTTRADGFRDRSGWVSHRSGIQSEHNQEHLACGHSHLYGGSLSHRAPK